MVGVRIEALRKAYGDAPAVDGVNLEIERGELFFLLGPSGCGKTTILRMIAGFVEPDSGSIYFDDRRMNDVPPHKRNTGMVFQNYALWPHMTVAENVGYGLEVRGIGREERRERVEKSLTIVRMEGLGERFPHQLSGGQQQRVALARALVLEPDLILLDEPLSNLDAKLRVELREEIKRIHRETGITTLYVTHDQKEALSLAQRIAVLRAGRIEQIGPPKELYYHPKNRFVAEFLGETNMIEGTVAEATDGRLTLRTKLGLIEGRGEAAPGQDVVCCLRPEALRPGHSDRNSIRARVVETLYLGEVEILKVESAAGVLKVLLANPRQVSLREGDECTLCFAPEDAVILRTE